MIGHIAQAVGAPTPTLVLDERRLPQERSRLRAVLTAVRAWLAEAGRTDILKIALVAPSPHPLFDLDYRFVQALPEGHDRFDFVGSCGHSVLASVLAAADRGWLPRLAPGGRVRVRVCPNEVAPAGDRAAAVHMVCQIDEARLGSGTFTVHFLPEIAVPLADLLLTGRSTDQLLDSSGVHEASLVSMGNPYLFVDAAAIGLSSREQLFHAGTDIFERLLRIRRAAAELLRWPTDGVFPKIAAVGAYQPGRLAVRAISVPSWHPSLALTGATCLAAAVAVPGTVPHRLTRATAPSSEDGRGGPGATIGIDTPGGSTTVTCAGSGEAVRWVSIGRKAAHLERPVRIPPLEGHEQLSDDHLLDRLDDLKEQTWQTLTV